MRTTTIARQIALVAALGFAATAHAQLLSTAWPKRAARSAPPIPRACATAQGWTAALPLR